VSGLFDPENFKNKALQTAMSSQIYIPKYTKFTLTIRISGPPQP